MARITIEDCMKRIPNRFLIVQMASQRVRQLREGAELLIGPTKNEEIVTSLREIAADKIYVKADQLYGIEAYMDFYNE